MWALRECPSAQQRSLRNLKPAPIHFPPNLGHHKNSGSLLDSNTNNNSMDKITSCDNNNNNNNKEHQKMLTLSKRNTITFKLNLEDKTPNVSCLFIIFKKK